MGLQGRRLYEIYRQLGLDWQAFQVRATLLGWSVTSPHQCLHPEVEKALLAAFDFEPLEEQSLLLARLRELLQALPDAEAGREMQLLLRRHPYADAEERSFVIEYAQEHIKAAWPDWPGVGIFDWEKVEATPRLWEVLEQVLSGGEVDELPIALLYDTPEFFQPRLGEGAESPLVDRLQDESYLDGLWACCNNSAEDWGEMLMGLGFWDHPEHHARCRAWIDAWEQDPTLTGMVRLGRLKKLWAEVEPTFLVALELEERLQRWRGEVGSLIMRHFFDELEEFSEMYNEQVEYSGLVVRKLTPKRQSFSLSEPTPQARSLIQRRLLPQCKKHLEAHMTQSKLKSLSLSLDVQCESGMSYVREGLEEAVRRCVPEDDLHYRLQWLSDGLSVSCLKAYPIHTEDSISLTCCGSSEYIIEALCGYFLIQSYRFC